MSYRRTTNLIVRPTNAGYSLSGIWDSVSDFGKNVLTAYGDQKKAEGAASATAITTPAGTIVPGVTPGYDTGPSMGTIALIASVGIGAIFLLKKRKK